MRVPKIICLVGPTASGKTALGIALAKRFSGEIVNADSRQVYKGFEIGTGMPAGKRGTIDGHRAFVSEGVPHYLMDYLEPMEISSVTEWREKALVAIKGIEKRKHVPMVVGGTGLYLQSLVDNYSFPQVAPNPTMRAALETKSLPELVSILLKIDPAAEQAVDLKNQRRVIRALEVATFTGKPFSEQKTKGKPLVEALQIGVLRSREELIERIDAAVDEMIARGWVVEIKRAIDSGIREDAPAMTSIGYRELLSYIHGDEELEVAVKKTKQAVHRYAKRQVTWFKRDTRIHWVKNEQEAVELVEKFLE